MSVGKEALEVEGPVVDWAKKHKWLHLKINGLGKRGFPDQFFFGHPRVLVMMEFKAPGRKPKPIQKYIHEWLIRLGWPVYIVDRADDGIRILKEERKRGLESQAVPRTSNSDDDGAGGGRPVSRSGDGED